VVEHDTVTSGFKLLEVQESQESKKKRVKIGLVRRISMIIEEITAYPPDFTQLFILIPCECLERRGVDECIVPFLVESRIFVRVECGTNGKCFEDRFHCRTKVYLQLIKLSVEEK